MAIFNAVCNCVLKYSDVKLASLPLLMCSSKDEMEIEENSSMEQRFRNQWHQSLTKERCRQV